MAKATSTPVRVTDERIKMSLVLNRKHLVTGQRIAREIGISFNGYVNLALQTMNQLRAQQSLFPLVSPTPTPPAPMLQLPQLPAPPPARPTVVHRASPVSEGYTLPADDPNETAFAPWPIVERYANLQRQFPQEDFVAMARRLGIDAHMARAADAAQASPEFERWLRSQRRTLAPAPTKSKRARRRR